MPPAVPEPAAVSAEAAAPALPQLLCRLQSLIWWEAYGPS